MFPIKLSQFRFLRNSYKTGIFDFSPNFYEYFMFETLLLCTVSAKFDGNIFFFNHRETFFFNMVKRIFVNIIFKIRYFLNYCL